MLPAKAILSSRWPATISCRGHSITERIHEFSANSSPSSRGVCTNTKKTSPCVDHKEPYLQFAIRQKRIKTIVMGSGRLQSPNLSSPKCAPKRRRCSPQARAVLATKHGSFPDFAGLKGMIRGWKLDLGGFDYGV